MLGFQLFLLLISFPASLPLTPAYLTSAGPCVPSQGCSWELDVKINDVWGDLCMHVCICIHKQLLCSVLWDPWAPCVHISLGTCTDTENHGAICTSSCLGCFPGRDRIDPYGHGVLPSVQGLPVSTGYLGTLTKCQGHEWCMTFHLKLCEDPQGTKQVVLTPLTPPESLCECKASSLSCSHLSPQCPMYFMQSAVVCSLSTGYNWCPELY